MTEHKSHEEGWVCPVCNLARGSNGHDPCIANLPGVKFACCGHGGANGAEPYLVFETGVRIGFMPRSISYDDGRQTIVFDARMSSAINGWRRTALAMRDAAIMWEQDGKNRSDEIQSMYFNAAMGLGFVESDAFKSP